MFKGNIALKASTVAVIRVPFRHVSHQTYTPTHTGVVDAVQLCSNCGSTVVHMCLNWGSTGVQLGLNYGSTGVQLGFNWGSTGVQLGFN